MFKHLEIDYPSLSRETIDGVRYYDTPDGKKLVSITSVISHHNREIFTKWRKRVGVDEANKITKAATSRGTDMHTLTEHYLLNQKLPSVQPLSEFLFKQAKPTLEKIDNIHAIEQSLFSKQLGVAGTVDCIAEYDGVLSIIDFKTSTKERSDSWNENYYIQGSAYAEMFEERTSIPVQQVVILVVTEDGTVQEFVKDKEEYLPLLEQAVADFTQKEQESAKTN